MRHKSPSAAGTIADLLCLFGVFDKDPAPLLRIGAPPQNRLARFSAHLAPRTSYGFRWLRASSPEIVGVVEVAAGDVVAPNQIERRELPGAPLVRLRAAGVEAAAFGRVDGARHVAGEQNAATLTLHGWIGDGDVSPFRPG